MPDEEDELDFGLDDLLPEPDSPLPAPFSFATYDVPEGFDLDLPDQRKHIITRLVGSHPLWGHHLWNTSRTLSTYLLQHESLWQDKAVVELGAGAGLPSIVTGLGGAAKTVVTDYPDESLVQNLRYNLDMNLTGERRAKSSEAGHVWGYDPKPLIELSPEGEKYDLMLLSDLMFNHSQHGALVQTVNNLISDKPNSCILVFFTHHRTHLVDADMAFFPLLAKSAGGWAYQKVVEDYTGPMFENDPGDERVRGTVHGWKAWRVAPGEQPGEKTA